MLLPLIYTLAALTSNVLGTLRFPFLIRYASASFHILAQNHAALSVSLTASQNWHPPFDLFETRLHLESTLLTPPPHRISRISTNTVRIRGARADYLCHHHSSLDEHDELVDTRDHLIAGRILTRYEVRGTDISRTGGGKVKPVCVLAR